MIIMSDSRFLEYTGEVYEFDQSSSQINSNNPRQPYIPSPDLIDVVNLAIDLGRPLLIEGEPGCGKTELAAAIANEFAQKYLEPGEEWPFATWNVKSIEVATDGLYTFDAISKMQDAQLAGALGEISEEDKESLLERLRYQYKEGDDINNHPYIKLGKLGEALRGHYPPSIRPILLIDEIDKADVDFPNDLLMELDKGEFEIREIRDKYPKQITNNNKPIIIITSNRERPLSDAFLRRCIYFYLDFPDKKILTEIIDKRFPGFGQGSQEGATDLIPTMIKTLETMRSTLDAQPGVKKPGTSEMIDLIKYLQKLEEKSDSANALAALKNITHKSPLLGILLKTKAAQDIIASSQSATRP
jgi:MoxR-like ATPase